MPRPTIWHGSEAQAIELLRAIAHHCSCAFSATGERLGSCSVHTMLAYDQRALDGLLFARHMSSRWSNEEWCSTLPESSEEPSPSPVRARTPVAVH